MDLEAFTREVQARGGACAMWLVYLADRFALPEGGWPGLVLQGAFFTRGEAYAFAEGRRRARMWQHYYVFRVELDVAWIATESPRQCEFESAFGRPRQFASVSVTPTQLANALAD